jgi:predicted enzyme related to lactoylglutathione lyase
MILRFAVAFVSLALTLADAAPLGPDAKAGLYLPGKFTWFDLATDDPAGARAFYGAVFGWRFRDVQGAPASYTIIENGASRVGGMFARSRPPGARVGSRWLSLISVRDAAKTAQLVRQRGGTVLLEPTTIKSRGTHAVFRDPQGAVFGVLASEDGDPADDAVADGDVFWLDLFTPDPQRAAAFYAEVGGYEVGEGDTRIGVKRRYLLNGAIARAGVVVQQSAGLGAGWLPYILVDDVAATVERARAAKGKVIVAPRADLLDGNLAVVADPNGGVIGIVNWLGAPPEPGPAK